MAPRKLKDDKKTRRSNSSGVEASTAVIRRSPVGRCNVEPNSSGATSPPRQAAQKRQPQPASKAQRQRAASSGLTGRNKRDAVPRRSKSAKPVRRLEDDEKPQPVLLKKECLRRAARDAGDVSEAAKESKPAVSSQDAGQTELGTKPTAKKTKRRNRRRRGSTVKDEEDVDGGWCTVQWINSSLNSKNQVKKIVFFLLRTQNICIKNTKYKSEVYTFLKLSFYTWILNILESNFEST